MAILSIKSIYIVNNPWGSYATLGIVDGRRWGFGIRALHAGGRPDPAAGARAVPVCQTTSFVFEDSPYAADLFALRRYHNICSRIGNSAVAAFEQRMTSQGEVTGAVAISSGQAAELPTCTALAAAGDHLVASAALEGAVREFVFGVTARDLSQVV